MSDDFSGYNRDPKEKRLAGEHGETQVNQPLDFQILGLHKHMDTITKEWAALAKRIVVLEHKFRELEAQERARQDSDQDTACQERESRG